MPKANDPSKLLMQRLEEALRFHYIFTDDDLESGAARSLQPALEREIAVYELAVRYALIASRAEVNCAVSKETMRRLFLSDLRRVLYEEKLIDDSIEDDQVVNDELGADVRVLLAAFELHVEYLTACWLRSHLAEMDSSDALSLTFRSMGKRPPSSAGKSAQETSSFRTDI